MLFGHLLLLAQRNKCLRLFSHIRQRREKLLIHGVRNLRFEQILTLPRKPFQLTFRKILHKVIPYLDCSLMELFCTLGVEFRDLTTCQCDFLRYGTHHSADTSHLCIISCLHCLVYGC